MSKFCGKCGRELNKKTGKCPKCDTTSTVKNTVKNKIKRFFLKFLIFVLVVVILALGISGTLVYFDIIDIPSINDLLISVGIKESESTLSDDVKKDYEEDTEGIPESYKVNPIDAEAYFESTSKVISKVNVNDSDKVTTEEETLKLLAERGFEGYPITTEYSMNGEYHDSVAISNSNEKHPIYEMYYVASNGDVWNIFIVNGSIITNPVSYNIEFNSDIRIILAETSTLTSYDSATNKFYETVPDESVLKIKTVNRIDANTLNKLTTEAIDKL